MNPKSPRKRGAPKGNHNALKHGLYAKHYTPEILPELQNMPTDDCLMELAAGRAALARALDIYYNCQDADRQVKLFNSCVIAFKFITNTIQKLRLASGSSPQLQELWDALKQSNRIEKIPPDI